MGAEEEPQAEQRHGQEGQRHEAAAELAGQNLLLQGIEGQVEYGHAHRRQRSGLPGPAQGGLGLVGPGGAEGEGQVGGAQMDGQDHGEASNPEDDQPPGGGGEPREHARLQEPVGHPQENPEVVEQQRGDELLRHGRVVTVRSAGHEGHGGESGGQGQQEGQHHGRKHAARIAHPGSAPVWGRGCAVRLKSGSSQSGLSADGTGCHQPHRFGGTPSLPLHPHPTGGSS